MNDHHDHHDPHDQAGGDLTAELRTRLADVTPDLDRLARVSTDRGTRQRRTRRLSVGAAAAAGVGAVAAAAVLLGPAVDGSSPDRLATDDGLGVAAAPGTTPPTTTPTTPPTPPAPPAPPTPPTPTVPVVLDLAGWTCGPAADEKMKCSSATDGIGVTWRPAAEHERWTSDPDKTASYVSEVHGDLFVTAVVSAGTPDAVAVAVGEALRWVD